MNLSVCNSLEEPYFHIFIGERDKIVNEIQRNYTNEENIMRIVNGSECNNIKNLFKEFSSKLDFPRYFSGVWGSFDECINDLEWISGNRYIILITNVENILKDEPQELETLFMILRDCTEEWANGRNYDDFPTPPTPFHIILNCSNESVCNIDKVFTKLKINWSMLEVN